MILLEKLILNIDSREYRQKLALVNKAEKQAARLREELVHVAGKSKRPETSTVEDAPPTATDATPRRIVKPKKKKSKRVDSDDEESADSNETEEIVEDVDDEWTNIRHIDL